MFRSAIQDKPEGYDHWKPLKLQMQNNPYAGKLIVLDGLDGSGKSSLIDAISHYMNTRQVEYVMTKTPTDDVRSMRAWRQWSDRTQGLSRHEIHGYGLSIIAFGARLVHQRQFVEVHLSQGKIVISDRYILSSVVYESGLVHEELSKLLIRPDLGILVDVSPDEAMRRVRKRENEVEHPDDKSDAFKLRDRYRKLASLNGYVVVDTTDSTVPESLKSIEGHLADLVRNGSRSG